MEPCHEAGRRTVCPQRYWTVLRVQSSRVSPQLSCSRSYDPPFTTSCLSSCRQTLIISCLHSVGRVQNNNWSLTFKILMIHKDVNSDESRFIFTWRSWTFWWKWTHCDIRGVGLSRFWTCFVNWVTDAATAVCRWSLFLLLLFLLSKVLHWH